MAARYHPEKTNWTLRQKSNSIKEKKMTTTDDDDDDVEGTDIVAFVEDETLFSPPARDLAAFCRSQLLQIWNETNRRKNKRTKKLTSKQTR